MSETHLHVVNQHVIFKIHRFIIHPLNVVVYLIILNSSLLLVQVSLGLAHFCPQCVQSRILSLVTTQMFLSQKCLIAA